MRSFWHEHALLLACEMRCYRRALISDALFSMSPRLSDKECSLTEWRNHEIWQSLVLRMRCRKSMLGVTLRTPLSGTCLLKEVCRKPLFGVWLGVCGRPVPNVALTEKIDACSDELTSCSCGRLGPVDPTLFIGKACYNQPRPTQNHTISLLGC